MSDPLEWPRLALCGVRVVRQYCVRIEALISVLFICAIYMYVRWLGDRYRPFMQGRHLTTRAVHTNIYRVSLSDIPFNEEQRWIYDDSRWSFCAAQGIRLSMEDRVDVMAHQHFTYFGLYDGHGGQFVSDYLQKNMSAKFLRRFMEDFENANTQVNISKILHSQIMQIDAQISGLKTVLDYTGSTLVSVVFAGSEYIYVANVGDSRAIMCLPNGKAHQITIDHKPSSESERRRIEAAGGWIAWLGVWRVAGILATSRAIGDTFLKRAGYLTASPEMFVIDRRIHKPQFLIVASDGLWDVVTNQMAVDIISKAINQGQSARGTRALVELALTNNSTDNVSVMVIPVL